MGSLLGRFFLSFVTFLESSWGKWIVVLLAPIVGYFALLVKMIDLGVTKLNSLMDLALTSTAGTGGSVNIGTAFGICNYFVPLDLIFNYCALGVELMIGALIYRAIKSWVPTLS